MKVNILHKGILIGCSHLDAADPTMGVATGPLEPTSDYDPLLYASFVDGDDNELRSETPLSVHSEDFGAITCEGVYIEDCSKILGELNVTVLGISHPDYETFFATYPS